MMQIHQSQYDYLKQVLGSLAAGHQPELNEEAGFAIAISQGGNGRPFTQLERILRNAATFIACILQEPDRGVMKSLAEQYGISAGTVGTDVRRLQFYNRHWRGLLEVPEGRMHLRILRGPLKQYVPQKYASALAYARSPDTIRKQSPRSQMAELASLYRKSGHNVDIQRAHTHHPLYAKGARHRVIVSTLRDNQVLCQIQRSPEEEARVRVEDPYAHTRNHQYLVMGAVGGQAAFVFYFDAKKRLLFSEIQMMKALREPIIP